MALDATYTPYPLPSTPRLTAVVWLFICLVTWLAYLSEVYVFCSIKSLMLASQRVQPWSCAQSPCYDSSFSKVSL